MTTPASSGGRSPLRVGGIALLAVGVIAGLIGAITLATSDTSSDTAAPPPPPPATATVEPTPAPPATAEPAPAPAPTDAPGVPVPSFVQTAPPAALPTPPPPGAAPQDQNAPKDAAQAPRDAAEVPRDAAEAPKPAAAPAPGSVERAPLRVYSNGTIQGIAGRAAEDFKRSGWQVERVDNYPSGTIPTSTAYFRPGTPEQAAAQALGSEFGLRVEPRFTGLTEASPGVIVIITNDYRSR